MLSDDKPFSNVTIKDVAKVAGVSHATVSRVINNTTKVADDKRERILDAMDRLGYVPNMQARSLAGGRTKVIGLLVPDIGNGYTGTIIEGIDAELSAHDYDMMLYTTHHRKVKEPIYVQSLTQGMAAGLLLLLPVDPSAYLEGLRRKKFPYVVIDHQGFDNFSSTVGATNRQGVYDGITYLIELGHRRIGFVSGPDMMSCSMERLAGYRAVLNDQGISYDDRLIVPGNHTQLGGYKACVQLLDLEKPPSAIFAANDVSAFGVIDAARARGMHIPDDISIMGFDDIPQAGWMTPALTTVRQPLFAMGRQAAKMLFEFIEEPKGPMRRLQLSTELVIRETCARFKDI